MCVCVFNNQNDYNKFMVILKLSLKAAIANYISKVHLANYLGFKQKKGCVLRNNLAIYTEFDPCHKDKSYSYPAQPSSCLFL